MATGVAVFAVDIYGHRGKWNVRRIPRIPQDIASFVLCWANMKISCTSREPSLLEIVSKLIRNRSREKERDRDGERMGRDRGTEGRSKTVPNELRVIASTVAKLPCWMVFIFDSWVRHSQWKGMLTLS